MVVLDKHDTIDSLRRVCSEEDIFPETKKCSAPERKMWCPVTKIHTVAVVSGARTGTLGARENGVLSTDWNGNGVPPIGTKITERPERSAQDHRLRRAGVTVGRDVGGRRKGGLQQQRRGMMETGTSEMRQIYRVTMMSDSEMQDYGDHVR